ncbi:MAG TPA: serine hydrolase domain-containing protein [Nitriliruptorales bacterium]
MTGAEALIDECGDAVSCVAAASVGGERVWTHAAGWADRERGLPAGPDVAYCIASLTKPLTALGVLRLVEQDRIDLGRPIELYLPRPLATPVGTPDEVTVERVLGHLAGLPLHMQFFYADEPDHRRPGVDVTLARYGQVVVPPGERHLYSNLGYGLLSEVVARVTGRAWEDVVADEVLAPLGMTSSWVGPDHRPGSAAARYGRDGVAYPAYDVDHPGASLGWATITDLVRLGDAVAGGAGLPVGPSTRDRMLAPVSSVDGGGAYGLGWIIEDWGGSQVVRHGGSMGGVRASLVVLPDEGITIAVVANTTASTLPERVTEAVLSELAPQVVAWPHQDRSITARADRALVGAWEGTVQTYAGDHPLSLAVAPERIDVTYRGQRSVGTPLPTTRFAVRFEGRLGTPDADRRPHELVASLTPRGDVLDGFVTAMYTLDGDEEGGGRGRRMGNAFSHHSRLDRVR